MTLATVLPLLYRQQAHDIYICIPICVYYVTSCTYYLSTKVLTHQTRVIGQWLSACLVFVSLDIIHRYCVCALRCHSGVRREKHGSWTPVDRRRRTAGILWLIIWIKIFFVNYFFHRFGDSGGWDIVLHDWQFAFCTAIQFVCSKYNNNIPTAYILQVRILYEFKNKLLYINIITIDY